MKKTLLAAALLAGFAGVAQAETQVTLYGIVDGGLLYSKVDAAPGGSSHNNFGMTSGGQSGSRWGLRGVEDLGDGLQAVFNLESGFSVANGTHTQNDRLFGRQATLGLASANWGRLEFGRQSNISSKYLAAVDPFGAGFTPSGAGNMGAAFGLADTIRYDNMIMYQTPSFSGFSVGVDYSFNSSNGGAPTSYDGDGNANSNLPRAVDVGLKYSSGPLYVALAYSQRMLPHGLVDANGNEADPRSYGIAASYDFEVAKLSLAYARTTDIDAAGPNGIGKFYSNNWAQSATGGDGAKGNSYLVGVTVPVGKATNILASWQAVDPSGYEDAFGVEDADSMQHFFTLGATYNLSKRTNLYAAAAYIKHVDFSEDRDGRSVMAGLRHQF